MPDQQPHVPAEATRSTPRTPGLVNSAIALGLTVLLAAVALTVRQPPPPAIAEFAPQAVEQIKEAPSEQSSEFGSAGGSGFGEDPPDDAVPDDPSTNTTTLPDGSSEDAVEDRVEVASIRRCIGNPPRQTDDPQSPPCVAFFEGDNGGATSPGVTADTIKIAVPAGIGVQVNRTFIDLVHAMFAHFNQRYEFYGRRLVPEFFDVTGGQGGAQRPGQRASADTAKQRGVFASTSILFAPGYYERLVDHKIIGTYRTADYTDSYLAANSPYIWGYMPSSNQIQSGLADWACSRLLPGRATYAGISGTGDLSERPRKFGIVMQIPDESSPNRAAPLKAALEACGAEVPYVLEDYGVRVSNNQASVNNAVLEMRDKGVTSAFMLVEAQHTERYHNAASAQRYEPEWLITNYPSAIWSTSFASKNKDQSRRTFGAMFQPMDRVVEDHPSSWAIRDGGETPGTTSAEVVGGQNPMYRDLLVLASGIQMAGPNLTPETFRDGLRRARFPNPPHPIMSGTVGFDEGDHSMLNDGVEVWWNNDEEGPYIDTPDGALCWMGGGARRTRGQWGKGDEPFFNSTACDYGTKAVS